MRSPRPLCTVLRGKRRHRLHRSAEYDEHQINSEDGIVKVNIYLEDVPN